MFLRLDLWFQKWRPNVPDGEAIIVRYADDIVVANTSGMRSETSVTFGRGWPAFGLSLHQDKTASWSPGRSRI